MNPLDWSWLVWFMIASIVMLAIGILLNLPKSKDQTKKGTEKAPERTAKKFDYKKVVLAVLILAALGYLALQLYVYFPTLQKGIQEGFDVTSAGMGSSLIVPAVIVAVLCIVLMKKYGGGIKQSIEKIIGILRAIAALLFFGAIIALIGGGFLIFKNEVGKSYVVHKNGPVAQSTTAEGAVINSNNLELRTTMTNGQVTHYWIQKEVAWRFDAENYDFNVGFVEGDGDIYRIQFNTSTMSVHADCNLGLMGTWSRFHGKGQGILTITHLGGADSKEWSGIQYIRDAKSPGGWKEGGTFRICPIDAP